MEARSPAAAPHSDVDLVLKRGVAAAQALLAAEHQPCVYVGGAPTAGLGSPRSDVDIFVLTDETGAAARQFEFGGQRVDIESVSLDRLMETVRLVSPFRATHADLDTVVACTRGRLDTLVRFHYGVTVADDGRLAVLRTAVDDALPALTNMLIARHAVDCLNLLEDITGAWLNGDDESAMMQALTMYSRAVEAVLCRHGDLYVGAKWIWMRWARTLGDRTDAPPLRGAAPAGTSALDLVHDAQDLLTMALTGSLYRQPATPAPRDARPAELVPMLTSQGVSLYSVSSLHAIDLSWQGLLLWGLAGRRDPDAAVDALLDLLATRHNLAEVPRSDVQAYYRHLVDIGALKAAQ